MSTIINLFRSGISNREHNPGYPYKKRQLALGFVPMAFEDLIMIPANVLSTVIGLVNFEGAVIPDVLIVLLSTLISLCAISNKPNTGTSAVCCGARDILETTN